VGKEPPDTVRARSKLRILATTTALAAGTGGDAWASDEIVRLVCVRGAAAEGCSDAAVIAGRVSARLGRNVFSEKAPNTIWATGFILHYDGTSWSFALMESMTGFAGVWASSPNDSWAGTYPGANSFYAGDIQHWNGSAWAPEANLPPTTSELDAVGGSGPGTCGRWAIRG